MVKETNRCGTRGRARSCASPLVGQLSIRVELRVGLLHPRPHRLNTSRLFLELGVPADYCAATAHTFDRPFPIQTSTCPTHWPGATCSAVATGSGKLIAFCLPVAIPVRGRRGKARCPACHDPGADPQNWLNGRWKAMRPTAKSRRAACDTIVGKGRAGSQVSALRGASISSSRPQGASRPDQTATLPPGLRRDQRARRNRSPRRPQVPPGVQATARPDPQGGQRLLFSATLDGAVGVLVRKYLENPVTPRRRGQCAGAVDDPPRAHRRRC